MKINFVLPGFGRTPSGGYKIVYEYANYLTTKGWDVTIYFLINNSLKRFKLPKTIRILLSKIFVWYYPNWFSLDKRIKKIGILSAREVIVEKKDWLVATAVETAEVVKEVRDCRKAYLIQGFENWNVSDKFVYETYGYGFLNITVAKWLSKIVDEHSFNKSICISNSVDTDIFCVRNSIKNRKKHSIIFHYRSAPYKGCKYAFEVIKKLQNLYDDLHVIVVSSEHKPIELPDCCNFIYNAKPEQVAQINNNATVFMCTSIEEGFGLPGLEAMACGCVLVSFKYKGVFEYAVDSKNALLSDIKDVNAMVNNIVKIFENEDFRIRIAMVAAQTGAGRSLKSACENFEKVLS